MKIIEALKKIKHLDRKIGKAELRISEWASYVEVSDEGGNVTSPAPLYNAEDIRVMIQQIGDWQTEKARLRHLLHKTNVLTTTTFDGSTYNIDELLLLQNLILPSKLSVQKLLTRQRIVNPAKQKVIMQYDAKEREMEIDRLDDLVARLNSMLDQMSLSVDVIEG